MTEKRLRGGKTVKTERVVRLSELFSNQIKDALQRQIFLSMNLPDDCKETAAELLENSYRALRAQNEFSDYCHIIAGEYALQTEEIELCSFLGGLCGRVRDFADGRSIPFTYAVPGGKMYLSTDAEKLRYAVLNVVLNAMEHGSGEKVALGLSATKKYAKITVRDRGEGMAPEVLARCCEPLYSYHVGAGKSSSLGLGLTLAKHFAECCGGRLGIKSAEKAGTTVTLLLPLAETAAHDGRLAAPLSDDAAKDIAAMRIVLAEL